MRFLKQRPSSRDKDIPVYEFALGKVKLELTLGICNTTFRNLPAGMEFQQTRARLRNMMKVIKNVLDENYGRKNTKIS